MIGAIDKAKFLAREYVARVESEARFILDDDLRRIVLNTYEAGYLRGSADTIDDYPPSIKDLVAKLKSWRGEGL